MPKIYPSKVLLTVGDPSPINNMWFLDSRPFRFQATTLGKSFALVRDGKCRSVVELAMHHRVQCSIDLRARGLYKGDGGPEVPTFVQRPGTPQRQHNHTCWVALPPSVPSTHHFHHPLPLHSSTPDLKPSFSANPSHRSPPFLLPDWLHGFPGLFTDTSEHIRFYSIIFYFVVFLFSTVVVPCCRLIWLM